MSPRLTTIIAGLLLLIICAPLLCGIDKNNQTEMNKYNEKDNKLMEKTKHITRDENWVTNRCWNNPSIFYCSKSIQVWISKLSGLNKINGWLGYERNSFFGFDVRIENNFDLLYTLFIICDVLVVLVNIWLWRNLLNEKLGLIGCRLWYN